MNSLQEAVLRGSLTDVERLIALGHSPNKSSASLPTPIYCAVHQNRLDIALALLKAGCCVKPGREHHKLACIYNVPLICLAADMDMTEVVLELCKLQDCDIMTKDLENRTIVHIGVQHKNYELIEKLPVNRFLKLRDDQNQTPIHIAADLGDLRMLKTLLGVDHMEKPLFGINHKECEYNAPFLKDTEVVYFNRESEIDCTLLKSLTQEKTDSERRNDSLKDLSNSIKTTGNNKLLFDFSESLPSIKQPESNSIFCEKKVSGMICEHKASDMPNLIKTNLISAEELLTLINLPTLGTKYTPLHFAAKGQHVEVIEFLLGQGAKVNALNLYNNTPLHCLFMEGKACHRAVKAATLLLEAGADCNILGTFVPQISKTGHHIQRQQKVSAATVAARRNSVRFLKLVASFGADFESKDSKGMTALLTALCWGSEEAAWYLLTHHPESEKCRNTSGQTKTALHYVSHCHRKAGQLTRMLLEQGYLHQIRSSSTVFDFYCSYQVGCTVKHSMSPLICAINHCQLGVASELLHSNCQLLIDLPASLDPSENPLMAVIMAVKDTKMAVQFCRLLLRHGADMDACIGLRVVEYALESDNLAFAKFLISVGCDVNSINYVNISCTVTLSEEKNDILNSILEARGQPRSLRILTIKRIWHFVRNGKGPVSELVQLPLPRDIINDLLYIA